MPTPSRCAPIALTHLGYQIYAWVVITYAVIVIAVFDYPVASTALGTEPGYAANWLFV